MMSQIFTNELVKDVLHGFMANLGDMVCLFSMDGTVKYTSPACNEVLGYDLENKFIGKNFISFVHPGDQDKVFDFFTRITEGHEKRVHFECRLKNARGGIVWVSCSFTMIHGEYPGDNYILVVSTDISQQKEKEKELKNLFLQEKEKNTFREIFLECLSHDFRNPLNNLFFDLYLLEKELPEGAGAPYIKRIRSGAKFLQHVVGEMELVSGLCEEHFDVQLSAVSAGQLVKNLLEEVKFFDQERLRVVNDLQADESLLINQHILFHIVYNLLDNAFKYSGKDKEVELTLQRKDKYLTVKVTDHGAGIDKSEFEHIFKAHYRVDKAVKQYGRGIGLFIVKKAVAKLGGHIILDSNLGKGSQFTVKIPVLEGG